MWQVHEMRQERKDGVDRILMDKYRATDFNLLGYDKAMMQNADAIPENPDSKQR
jgi:hypothetical protein